jgi:hypothetical protein
MGKRTSAKYTVPGSPLAGVLRQQARAARQTTYRSAAAPVVTAGAAGATGEAGATGPVGPAGATGPAGPGPTATVLTTNATGDVTWTFPTPFAAPPVVVATGVAVATAVTVTVAAVSATAVSLKALKWNGTTFVNAGGAQIHVMAFI